MLKWRTVTDLKRLAPIFLPLTSAPPPPLASLIGHYCVDDDDDHQNHRLPLPPFNRALYLLVVVVMLSVVSMTGSWKGSSSLFPFFLLLKSRLTFHQLRHRWLLLFLLSHLSVLILFLLHFLSISSLFSYSSSFSSAERKNGMTLEGLADSVCLWLFDCVLYTTLPRSASAATAALGYSTFTINSHHR